MKAEATACGLSLWGVCPCPYCTDEYLFPLGWCPLISHSCQVTESGFELKFRRTPETGRVIFII